jgi:hypothetical protein
LSKSPKNLKESIIVVVHDSLMNPPDFKVRELNTKGRLTGLGASFAQVRILKFPASTLFEDDISIMAVLGMIAVDVEIWSLMSVFISSSFWKLTAVQNHPPEKSM